jgi:hypothetical protein
MAKKVVAAEPPDLSALLLGACDALMKSWDNGDTYFADPCQWPAGLRDWHSGHLAAQEQRCKEVRDHALTKLTKEEKEAIALLGVS